MITVQDISAALRSQGVESTDTVFVHSGLQRCLRVEGSTREQKLARIVGGLSAAVSEGILIFPTFTYSFCREEIFDVAQSPSTVGVLSEHFRRLPGVRRSTDPLFSVAIRGEVPSAWERPLFEPGDKDCFGEQSVFAMLREVDAKFVFFGVPATTCTFVHHIEQRQGVPYRYLKDFPGVVRAEGQMTSVVARYYVRDLDDDVETFLVPLVEDLRGAGLVREMTFDRGPYVCVASARDVESVAVGGMAEHRSYLLCRGHPHLAALHPV